MPPLRGIAPAPDDLITREGGSRPYLILLASDMNYYYCKAPHLMPNHQYIGVNELVTGQLARRLDIPTRPVEVIEWEDHLYVGVQVLPNDRKMTGSLTEATLGRLSNPQAFYPLVVLDAWTVNQDRHDGNWLGGVLGKDTGWFLANDHDMCLLASGIQPGQLLAMVTQPIDGRIIKSKVIADSIRSPFALREAIDRAEVISPNEIRHLVLGVPNLWLEPEGKEQLISFLIERRQLLGALFADSLGLFANLERL
jgi:hypothetical protein